MNSFTREEDVLTYEHQVSATIFASIILILVSTIISLVCVWIYLPTNLFFESLTVFLVFLLPLSFAFGYYFMPLKEKIIFDLVKNKYSYFKNYFSFGPPCLSGAIDDIKIVYHSAPIQFPLGRFMKYHLLVIGINPKPICLHTSYFESEISKLLKHFDRQYFTIINDHHSFV